MEEEVERHQIIRDSSEVELQALRERVLTVKNITENSDSENSTSEPPAEDQLSRSDRQRCQILSLSKSFTVRWNQ